MLPVRILLADADEHLLDCYREFLSRNGFEVAVATSGLDCVAKLRSFGPDILVLEPDLPWGQGEGVLALMREEVDTPAVPVLVLSARREPPGTSPGDTYPVREHQTKPLAPDELANSIRRLFEQTPPRGGFFG
jgi:DNA-binding response OmpR family regulator